ncbi:MAG: DUF2520 domain-containing protein [Bacteroidetes bacterium]|nr:DUF2520 domain-containing protein [Bacteroidota bacterium]
MNKRIYIIGTGRTGSAFANELNVSGFKVNFLTSRNIQVLKDIAEVTLPLAYSEKIEKDYIDNSDIILICVQDRFISEVKSGIIESGADLSGKYFIHTSGSESSSLFSEKNFNKSFKGSMHPIQTFDRISRGNNHFLNNIYFGIEGDDECKEQMKKMISAFDSRFIEIPMDKKYLYHSACVVSSNFLVTLMNISAELLGSIGIDKSKSFEIFKPIVMKTIENISENGLVNSLTGPFERNDLETVSNHLNSIYKELPSLIPFYTLLGMETVKVAFKKETLNLNNVISMLDLMNSYVANEIKTEKNKSIN